MTSEISSPLEGAVPVAWLWQYIGNDPLGAHIPSPCARSLHEMDPKDPPYPDTWTPIGPLYAAPLHPPASAVTVDKAHLFDLGYVLGVLEKIRDLVPFRKGDAANGEIAAAINGMKYVIDRTKRGCTSGPASAVMGEVRDLTDDELWEFVHEATGAELFAAIQKKYRQVNAGKTIPAAQPKETK